MVGRQHAGFPLPCQLAGSIHGDRIRRVELVIRLPFLTVEHVVRGDVHEDGSGSSAGLGHVSRAQCVGQKRSTRVLLTTVDRRHRGRVDDDLGLHRDKAIQRRLQIVDGQLFVSERDQFVIVPGRGRQGPAEAASRSGDGDPHTAAGKSAPTSTAMAAPRRTPFGAGRTSSSGKKPLTTLARRSWPVRYRTSLPCMLAGASRRSSTMNPARCSAACTCFARSPPPASSTTTLMVAGDAAVPTWNLPSDPSGSPSRSRSNNFCDLSSSAMTNAVPPISCGAEGTVLKST